MTTIPADVHDIYPMPMFASINTADPQALASWYGALGFWELFSVPGPDGSPRMIHLRRLRNQDLLIVHDDKAGDPAGNPMLTVAFGAHDDDIEAIAADIRELGSGAVRGPVVRPWNTAELVCTDPLGNVVVLTKVINRGAGLDETMASVQGSASSGRAG